MFPLISAFFPSFICCLGSWLSWLHLHLCIPDLQERTEGAICCSCPPGLSRPGLRSLRSPGGAFPSQPLFRLAHQSHPRGTDAPLPETVSGTQLSQLRPAPSSSIRQKLHYTALYFPWKWLFWEDDDCTSWSLCCHPVAESIRTGRVDDYPLCSCLVCPSCSKHKQRSETDEQFITFFTGDVIIW